MYGIFDVQEIEQSQQKANFNQSYSTGNFCVYGSVPRRYAAQGATRRALRAHTHAPIRPLLKRSGALRAPQTYNEPFLPSEYTTTKTNFRRHYPRTAASRLRLDLTPNPPS